MPEVEPGIFKDIHRGKRCVLLGNGPSLAEYGTTDFEDLGLTAIGINESWLVHPKTPYHCSQSPSRYDDVFLGRVSPRVFITDAAFRRRWRNGSSRSKYHGLIAFVGQHTFREARFSFDLSLASYGPFSGIFALQIAAYMGFTEIYLVGYDAHSDEGHFNDGRTVDRTSHLPYYLPVARWAESNDVKIVNCSSRSAIDCFPKGELGG